MSRVQTALRFNSSNLSEHICWCYSVFICSVSAHILNPSLTKKRHILGCNYTNYVSQLFCHCNKIQKADKPWQPALQSVSQPHIHKFTSLALNTSCVLLKKCIQVLLLPWWPSSSSLFSNSITSKTGKIRHALSARGGEDSNGSRGGYSLCLVTRLPEERCLPCSLPVLRSGWSFASGSRSRSELGWATSLGPTHSHMSATALKDTAGIFFFFFFYLNHLLFLSLFMRACLSTILYLTTHSCYAVILSFLKMEMTLVSQ